MDRRDFLRTLGLAATWLSIPQAATAREPRKDEPNTLSIISDHHAGLDEGVPLTHLHGQWGWQICGPVPESLLGSNAHDLKASEATGMRCARLRLGYCICF